MLLKSQLQTLLLNCDGTFLVTPLSPGASCTIVAEKLLLGCWRQEEPLGGVFSATHRSGICLFADAAEVVLGLFLFAAMQSR